VPAPQRQQGAAHVVLAHVELAGDRGRDEWLATGDLVVLVELLDALQRPPRGPGVLDLGAGAAGVGRLQGLDLLGGRVAVADRLAAQASQSAVGLVAGAQGVQPLAGDRGRRADLGRQLGGVEPLATRQLAGEVGVGDPVAHQPGAQLGQLRVALAVGAQHPQQVTGEPRRHAHLGRQGGRVDRPAVVDLTGQPGVGDPLPCRPRIGRPLVLLGRGRNGGGVGRVGHRRPPSRCGQTTRAAAACPCSRRRRRCVRTKARCSGPSCSA
jgi:hypothetical protein